MGIFHTELRISKRDLAVKQAANSARSKVHFPLQTLKGTGTTVAPDIFDCALSICHAQRFNQMTTIFKVSLKYR